MRLVRLLAQQAPLGLIEALAQRRNDLPGLLFAVLVAGGRQIAEAGKAGEPPLRSLRGQATELVVAGFGPCQMASGAAEPAPGLLFVANSGPSRRTRSASVASTSAMRRATAL